MHSGKVTQQRLRDWYTQTYDTHRYTWLHTDDTYPDAHTSTPPSPNNPVTTAELLFGGVLFVCCFKETGSMPEY